MEYDPSEQGELLDIFRDMLSEVTRDGGRKRLAGVKVNWKVDPGHVSAMYRHIEKWEAGEKHDPDSGAHPLVAAAWRGLAIAWRETDGNL